MSKGIIYCRVSSQEQTKGTSLDGQKQACLAYAENKDIKILKIFIEEGESATAADRTQLIKALDFCRENKGQVDAFIVWKIDRFARNTVDHYGLRAQLMKYGVRLHSVTEPINDDPIGKMTEAMLAGYAQFENDIRKQRCEGGMQRKLAQGIWIWTPPIGYVQSKKITDRRKMMPDEPDSERFFLIQRGLKEYAKGDLTIVGLTELFNKWSLKTRTNKPMFKQLVERMLRNKFYAGIIINPWNGEEYSGLHKPMITLGEFQKIQYIKEHFSRLQNIPHMRENPDFPLRRFILCVCGGKLTGSWRTGRGGIKYVYYHCNNEKCEHYSHGIPRKDLKRNGLEEKFIELLEKITPKEKFLKLFSAIVVDNWKSKHLVLKQTGQHYEQEFKRLEARKEQLLQMRMSNEISKEEFSRSRDNLDNQITALRISSNETKTDEFDVETAVSYAVQFISNLVRQWQDMNVVQKQKLQRLVLPNGLVYDKTTGKFGTAILSPIFKLNEEFDGSKSQLVAGTGIAPVPKGYEPFDLLLVHPAIQKIISALKNNANKLK